MESIKNKDKADITNHCHITTVRIKKIFVAVLVIMAALAARLWYIQIYCHDTLSRAAVSQYEVKITGLDTRGIILDRNLKPLTGETCQYYYIIRNDMRDEQMIRLMKDIEGKEVGTTSSSYCVYRTQSFNSNANEILREKYKAYVFENSARYADDQIACHLVGYLNEDKKEGVSGLELICEEQLESYGDSVNLWADAAGRIIKGLTPKITGHTKSGTLMEEHSLVTTLDRRLQFLCQQELEKVCDGGAVVVMDGESGEILAWASSPTFNPNRIEEYLETEGDCLMDKVCQSAYPPGSVFKIITAATALEKGVCNQEQLFTCEGKVTVGGITIDCATGGEEGHGSIDMTQAMACSCNCYFAQLGNLVGCDEIVNMAATMGLGRKTMEDFVYETEGNLPERYRINKSDTTNISIGQGELLATPLQIAKVTAIISSGGKDVTPKVIETSHRPYQAQVISPKTAQVIDSMMSKVMLYGTGKGNWPIPVRGKTGTAEAVYNEENVYTCWFTGYFSQNEKTYVTTVMIENGMSGGESALPVFKAVTDFLSNTP